MLLLVCQLTTYLGAWELSLRQLANHYMVGALVTVFLARFLIGPWSYAAGAPGGIFAPLVVLGASSGALFARVLNHAMPQLELSHLAFAVVGMRRCSRPACARR
jgi:CIC family chloride channel protein